MGYYEDREKDRRAALRREQWKRDQELADKFGASLGIYDDEDEDEDTEDPDEDEPYGFGGEDEGGEYASFSDLLDMIR